MKLVHNLTEHNKGVWQCDYSSKNSHFVSAGNDNQIILWDSTNYKVLNATTFHKDAIYDVKFSSSGNLIASCSKGVVSIWDVKRMSQPITVTESIS
jgi:WD40 repeat protein